MAFPLLLPSVLAFSASDCVREFQRCSAYCKSNGQARPCVSSCAKTSALCQQPAISPTVGLPKVTSSADSFAFTDGNGDRFIQFGFYQYTVTKDLDKRLPGEEAIHGMTLSSPYASTAAPDDAWWSAMTAFLDTAAAAGFRINFQLIGFETLGNDVRLADSSSVPGLGPRQDRCPYPTGDPTDIALLHTVACRTPLWPT